jgi:hypothetical protein
MLKEAETNVNTVELITHAAVCNLLQKVVDVLLVTPAILI